MFGGFQQGPHSVRSLQGNPNKATNNQNQTKLVLTNGEASREGRTARAQELLLLKRTSRASALQPRQPPGPVSHSRARVPGSHWWLNTEFPDFCFLKV